MNVVFDVGNVLVRWSPSEIMRRAMADAPDSDEWRIDSSATSSGGN
jgi:hypothetical protein